MDKNPNQILDNEFQGILNEFSKNYTNIILCSQPFMKSQFLNDLIDSADCPVIFLDFDLLYTGYIISKMITENDRVEIYQLEKENLEKIFSRVAKKVSEMRYLVILDSLNGFYNLYSKIESGIFINAVIMLLSSVAKQTDSIIVISTMARKKEDEGWVLSSGGRHIIESKNLGMYQVKNDEKSLFLRSLNFSSQKIFKINQK